MRTLYNILLRIFLLLASPYCWFRLRSRQNFAQRFGQYDRKLKQALTNRQVLWLHAAATPEINLCTQLLRALEQRVPNLKLIVSASTEAAMRELQRQLPSQISRIYFPIDRRAYVSRALNLTHPEAMVLLGAGIWPNFLWRARARGTPVFLVGPRLSSPVYRRYRRFRLLFGPSFASLSGVAVQTEAETVKLRSLGCRPERIQTVGSLACEAAPLEERRPVDVPAILRQLGVNAGALLLVASGTHPGEEALLAEQFLRLRPRFPGLFLVLAPRQFERSREAGEALERRGLRFVYRNEVMAHSHFQPGQLDCLLLNTPGELKHFYAEASLVFLGGSLTAQRGQDPTEPATLGKAIVFGPHMRDFAELARSFVEHDAALQARDPEDLEQRLAGLLADPSQRERLGRNVLALVRQRLASIDRTVEMILNHLDREEVYVAPRIN